MNVTAISGSFRIYPSKKNFGMKLQNITLYYPVNTYEMSETY